MSDQFISHNGQACGIMMSQNPELFHAVGIDDFFFKLMPGPEMNFKLYRGQNCFYPECVPSKYRHGSEMEEILQELKKNEFILLLMEHPVVYELHQLNCMGAYFQTDYEGLAQHYGFATSHLDLTNDRDVAMFFATTRFDQEHQAYEIIAEEFKAVIYTVNYLHPDVTERINIVGAQALPRPGMQKAYSISLDAQENFNDLTFVSYEQFICTKEISEHYFYLFDKGRKIFPDDVMDKRAMQIRESKAIDSEALEMYFNEHDLQAVTERESVIERLNKNGFVVKKKNSAITQKELATIRQQWQKDRQKLMDKIHLRKSFYVPEQKQ